ncbi:MAG: PRC-barrel domain-containing protein [Reyranellaceae bacterium]
MSIRNILMAGVAGAALMAAPVAMAQTQQNKSTTTAPSTATKPAAGAMQVDRLVGKTVENPDGDNVGDIESVYVKPDGKVDSVIIGVGGFLGIGEREVAIKWSDLTVSADGETITTSMTKEQLKEMPQYEYKDKTYRGKVFSDTGVMKTDRKPSDMATAPGNRTGQPAGTMAPDASTRADSARTPGSTADKSTMGDKTTMGKDRAATMDRDRTTADKPMRVAEPKGWTKTGEMSGDALIGASVKNAQGETIGDIKDIHLNKDGSVKAVVVGVGGFLGMGERDVLMNWNQIQVTRDDANGGDLVIRTEASKESLKSMPEYQM